MADDGVFLQWFQLWQMDPENVRTQLATFLSVFPEATFWEAGRSILMVGALRTSNPDVGRLKEILSDRGIAEDLGRIGLAETPIAAMTRVRSRIDLRYSSE